MVTKTFFANTDAISWTADSALKVSDVADGEIAVINIDTGLAVGSIAPNADLPATTRLMIVQGTPSTEPQIVSKIFKFRDVIYASGEIAVQAAVAQVSTVTITAADTASDCTLKVADLTEGYEPFPRKSWTVQAGEFTDINSLALAFRNKIAADESAKNFITVSGSGANIVLTHKTAGNSFATAFDPADGTSNISVAATTSPNVGVGLNAQMAEIEQASNYTRGRQTTNYFPQIYSSFVETNVNYLQHIQQVANDNDRHVLRENESNRFIFGIKDSVGSLVSSTYEKLFADSAVTPA